MRGAPLVVFLSILSSVYSLNRICQAIPVLSIVPNTEDCTRFSRCILGKLVHVPCPVGLAFNEISQACVDPKFSTCHVDRTPELKKLCKFFGNGYLLPNVDDCTKFYECAYEEPMEFVCSGGLVYNDSKKTCDYPERTTCSTTLRKLPVPEVQPLNTKIN